jgi:oxygen tolerance protein BatD
MYSRRIRFIAAALVLALLALLARSLRADELEARRIDLEPHTLAVGETAALRITAAGQDEPPAPRSVPGLAIFPAGESSSMISRNGAVSITRTRTWGVRAEKAGSFTIPVGAKTVQLDVRAGAPSHQAGAAPASPGAPATRDDSAEEPHGRAFLRLVPEKSHAFVGEAVPVAIKAYFQPGTEVTLTGPPQLGSSAFTIAPLGKPQQTRELVGGHTWAVVTWHTQLTPAVAGKQPTSVQLPATMRWVEAQEPADDPFRRFFRDPFGDTDDPFGHGSPFAGAFSAPRQRDVTLRSSATPFTVEALPAAGRPDDFQGAVGTFDVSARLGDGDGDARAHDPLKLTVELRGEGDLDRVRTVGIASSATWKAYPSAPAPGDHAGAGTRTFVQDIVPLRDGALTVPAVRFSYFDPSARRYVTKESAPIPVRVAAAEGADEAGSAATADAGGDKSAPTAPAAAGIDDRPTAHVRPLALRGWFLGLNALPPLAFLGVAAFERRRRARRSPAHEARQALRRQRAAMHAARKAGDRLGWLAAARRALQLHLAPAWRLPADDIDAAAVAARAPHASELIALFRASERAAYAHAAPATLDLAALDAVVERHLTQEVPL